MIYMPTQKKWEKQIYAKKKGGVVFVLWHLGDNCIVFENFMASIGDLMVANWVEQTNICYHYIDNMTSFEDFQFKT